MCITIVRSFCDLNLRVMIPTRPWFFFFFFKQKTAYEIGLGIPAEPLFRSTVKDCVTIDVLPRTPGNNVYVGFMVWSNFTATKCRGLVSLNQVIKEIICLQPLK